MNLEEFFKNLTGKVVIAGIGNPLREDDAVGSYIAKSIKNKVKALVLDCEDSPERYLGKIIEYTPNTIIFIDALDMKLEAGTLVFFDANKMEGLTTFTHNTSLKLYIDFIKKHINASVFILGIQPEYTNLGINLSKKVLETANILIDFLIFNLNLK